MGITKFRTTQMIESIKSHTILDPSSEACEEEERRNSTHPTVVEKRPSSLQKEEPEDSPLGRCCDHRDESREPKSHKKSVSFTSLDIRSYNVTIGDHPLCTAGCPLSLDWDYIESGELSIDEYEASRSPRRSRKELRTTSQQRHQILSEDHGYSETELKRAQRKMHRARSCSAKLCEKMSESFFQQAHV